MQPSFSQVIHPCPYKSVLSAHPSQEARLAECERMLVAIDLALHLNDSAGTLQAVVNCYGLLAPLIFNQIPSEPVIEVTTFRNVLDNTYMSVLACLESFFLDLVRV